MSHYRIISDLHEDIPGNSLKSLPHVDAKVTIVAGDVCAPGSLALRRVRELLPNAQNLIYVAGNHDYYSFADRKRPFLKTTYEREREQMPRLAEELGITFLDDSWVEIDGMRIIGSTLWTDMSLRPSYMSPQDAQRSAMAMNDYRVIKREPGGGRDRMTPAQTIEAHARAVEFITDALVSRPAGQDAVVVTHHAPSRRSLRGYDPAFPNRLQDLDFCFASPLEFLMNFDHAPVLWVHGHVHESRNYICGLTQVVSNPRGYPYENPDFDPSLVIEIEPRSNLSLKV
jgi:Icc-related predicted phosphoesterase